MPKLTRLGFLAAALPLIWYPKYLMMAFFAVLGQTTGPLIWFLLAYPLILIGAFLHARRWAANLAASIVIALFPLLALLGIANLSGVSPAFLFSY